MRFRASDLWSKNFQADLRLAERKTCTVRATKGIRSIYEARQVGGQDPTSIAENIHQQQAVQAYFVFGAALHFGLILIIDLAGKQVVLLLESFLSSVDFGFLSAVRVGLTRLRLSARLLGALQDLSCGLLRQTGDRRMQFLTEFAGFGMVAFRFGSEIQDDGTQLLHLFLQLLDGLRESSVLRSLTIRSRGLCHAAL